MFDAESVLKVAESAARSAGEILVRHFGSAEVHQKSTQNLVTQADYESETRISEIIEQHFPHHRIMREEGESTGDAGDEHLWVVDPLDATNNYAHGIPHYCVSIAYAYRGEVQVGVVLDPSRGELFSAVKGRGAFLNGNKIRVSRPSGLTDCLIATGFFYERGEVVQLTLDSIGRLFQRNIRGIRRMGAAALDLTWVACGRMQGFFEYRLAPWDFAAGWLIVFEAGGRCSDETGSNLSLRSNGIITASATVFDELKDVVARPK
jgi:myo-inositol-1(or 4)-monophosphatase